MAHLSIGPSVKPARGFPAFACGAAIAMLSLGGVEARADAGASQATAALPSRPTMDPKVVRVETMWPPGLPVERWQGIVQAEDRESWTPSVARWSGYQPVVSRLEGRYFGNVRGGSVRFRFTVNRHRIQLRLIKAF